MFFTARLASLFTSQSGSKLPSNRPEIPNSMENEVLEKFYLRRTSYCNQEDDEDRTDMEGIKPQHILPDSYPVRACAARGRVIVLSVSRFVCLLPRARMRARGRVIVWQRMSLCLFVCLSVCLSVQATKMSAGSDVGHDRSSVCYT